MSINLALKLKISVIKNIFRFFGCKENPLTVKVAKKEICWKFKWKGFVDCGIYFTFKHPSTITESPNPQENPSTSRNFLTKKKTFQFFIIFLNSFQQNDKFLYFPNENEKFLPSSPRSEDPQNRISKYPDCSVLFASRKIHIFQQF